MTPLPVPVALVPLPGPHHVAPVIPVHPDGRLHGYVNELREDTMRHEGQLSKHDTLLKVIDTRTALKPVPIFKIIGIAITVSMAAATGLWAMADSFSDRPTNQAVDRSFNSHEQNGHRDVTQKFSEIKIEQAEQRILLKVVKEKLTDQDRKLDDLLERTPPLEKTPKRRGR